MMFAPADFWGRPSTSGATLQGAVDRKLAENRPGEKPKRVMTRGIVTHIRQSHPEYQLRMSHWGMVIEAEGTRSQEVGPLLGR